MTTYAQSLSADRVSLNGPLRSPWAKLRTVRSTMSTPGATILTGVASSAIAMAVTYALDNGSGRRKGGVRPGRGAWSGSSPSVSRPWVRHTAGVIGAYVLVLLVLSAIVSALPGSIGNQLARCCHCRSAR